MSNKIQIELSVAGADPNEVLPLTGLKHTTDDGIDIPAIPIRLVGGVTETMLDATLTDDLIIRQAAGTPWVADAAMDVLGAFTVSGATDLNGALSVSGFTTLLSSACVRGNTLTPSIACLELRYNPVTDKAVVGAKNRALTPNGKTLIFDASNIELNLSGTIIGKVSLDGWSYGSNLSIVNAGSTLFVEDAINSETSYKMGGDVVIDSNKDMDIQDVDIQTGLTISFGTSGAGGITFPNLQFPSAVSAGAEQRGIPFSIGADTWYLHAVKGN